MDPKKPGAQNINYVVSDSESKGFMQKIADIASNFTNSWYGKATAFAGAAAFTFYFANAELVKDPKGGVSLSTQAAQASDLSKHYVKQSDKLYAAGDVDGGLAMARKALDADRSDGEAWNNIGAGLMRKKDFERALPFLEKATKLYSSCTVFGNLGYVQYQLGNKTAAREAFQEAARLCPTNPKYQKWATHLASR